VVTHLTTNPPVSCLNRAERTGSLVLKILWSYVKETLYCSSLVVSVERCVKGASGDERKSAMCRERTCHVEGERWIIYIVQGIV
jgi:hypothetical protein